MMEYQRDEHRVHLLIYHLIFCPKRTKSVLVDEVATECERLIREKCQQKNWHVVSLAVMPDHVHLFVRVFPTDAAADVVKEVKGYTAHELRLRFPHLKQRFPSMWTRSYFAASAGNVSDSTIRAYIAAQKGT
jgi:putative transposase